ncbi:hypothetical protein D3C80_1767230 [compost metagenome]
MLGNLLPHIFLHALQAGHQLLPKRSLLGGAHGHSLNHALRPLGQGQHDGDGLGFVRILLNELVDVRQCAQVFLQQGQSRGGDL